MAKRRRLGDLYVVGKEITFDDGGGDPVKVFVQKLTPLDQEGALRAANAKRSTTMSKLRDKNSAEYGIIDDEIQDLEKDDLISILVATDLSPRAQEVEAKISSEGEWAEDGYLEGLVEAWDSELSDLYHSYSSAEDVPEDKADDYASAVRALDELNRLQDEIDETLAAEKEDLEDTYKSFDLDSLQEKVIKLRLDAAANSDWFSEFRRQELFYATRDPQTKKLYFENRSEVDTLSLEVLGKLVSEYKALEVDALEGKS